MLFTQRSVNDAHSADRMVSVVGTVWKGCGPEFWAPYISPIGFFPSCFGGYDQSAGFVGEMRVPDGLWNIVYPGLGADWPEGIVRDENRNLLIGFEDSCRPTDGLICWLYLSADQEWYLSY